MMKNDSPEVANQIEPHLIVYLDKSIYRSHNYEKEFAEGIQDTETLKRYAEIKKKLEEHYLENLIEEIKKNPEISSTLSLDEEIKNVLNSISSYTSEQGRGLIGVFIGQLVIKSIAPEQDIRLHKGNRSKSNFSWKNGISMRSLNQHYIVPVLRSYDLLKTNNFGSMMTRTFAENYPYSPVYKAVIKGPKEQWLRLVDEIERNTVNALDVLKYLLSILLNRSEAFNQSAEEALRLVTTYNQQILNISEVTNLIKEFMDKTKYAPRVFEVALHSLLQALCSSKELEGELRPLSQMRSANKKHGNIGDIEISAQKGSEAILEAWDAKYRKPYLLDELAELADKLELHPETELAGFVVDNKPEMTADILARKSEIAELFQTQIEILSFDDWVLFTTRELDIPELPHLWLTAFVESFCQKRRDIAPIDEPCNDWVNDLIKLLHEKIQ